MKRIIAIILIIILLLIARPWHSSAPTPKQVVKPKAVSGGVCGFDAPPCISMTTPDKNYQFNDFRFKPNGCIEFDALPEHKAGSYCGPFELHWIGPVGGVRG